MKPVPARSRRVLGIAAAAAAAALLPTSSANACPEDEVQITYHTTKVDGLRIFYREAGPPEAPVLLLLHGFPSSSRMWEKLMSGLGDRYRLIAPDYPGFGNSEAPEPASFDYTFDHVAKIVDDFTSAVGVSRYALVMQDYGAPVGIRLALSHPERVTALIFQNSAAYDAALGPLWDARKAYWKDPQRYLPKIKENLLSLAAARQRHVGRSPHLELYDPDNWTDEFSFLSRPGQSDIQSTLFYDYRNNVAAYPDWQRWLRGTQPPLLVIWGRYDTSFEVEGATAFKKDVPQAEIHLLDAGHFPMDEQPRAVITITREFLEHLQGSGAAIRAAAAKSK